MCRESLMIIFFFLDIYFFIISFFFLCKKMWFVSRNGTHEIYSCTYIICWASLSVQPTLGYVTCYFVSFFFLSWRHQHGWLEPWVLAEWKKNKAALSIKNLIKSLFQILYISWLRALRIPPRAYRRIIRHMCINTHSSCFIVPGNQKASTVK